MIESKLLLTIIGWVFLIIAWVLHFFYKKTKKESLEYYSVFFLIMSLFVFTTNITINILNIILN
jgi:RsiW-degrading membrane proteinase PrsW (M82 family)